MVEFKLEINADDYPQEISWDLKDQSDIILFAGNLLNGDTVYMDSLCVPISSCLTFTIYDSAGDGLCCQFGQGSYKIFVDDVSIHAGANFGKSETTLLECPVGYSCETAEPVGVGAHTSPSINYWYAFTPDITASYILTTCDLTTCNTVLLIYDVCNDPGTENTVEGTTYYNEDACDSEQSAIQGSFEAGVTYYFRIGVEDGTCGGQPIGFSIINNGPITGCTDPTACNYNPLATVDDGMCIYDGPECNGGPDLVVSQDELIRSLRLTTIMNANQCTIDEGCLGGFGERDIIRFTTYIENIGEEDFYVGEPSDDNPLYTYDNCHGHWHYRGYAEYVLYDLDGEELPIGFKNGFCVIDLDCALGGDAKYSCSNQGITAKCADYYSSELSCQWIDITDVEAGTYTFVVRVNWERSRDALGNLENDYNNNWAQVCINIERDQDGQPSMSMVQECAPLVDCAGEIYGSAQKDCLGVCNGSAVRGDLNEDLVLNLDDFRAYTDGIVNNELSPSNCNDLNGDGELHVTDAAKVAACLYFDDKPDHPNAPSEPCTFGDQILNPNLSAEFGIMDYDTDLGYIDIGMLNIGTSIIGYEIDISGATIDNVINMTPIEDQDAILSFELDGDKIMVISENNESIDKRIEMEPILRVYYTADLITDICFEVVEVVNDKYHTIISEVSEASCLFSIVSTQPELTSGSISVRPNPVASNLIIEVPSEFVQLEQMTIRDAQGKAIEIFKQVDSQEVMIDVSTWTSGVYFIELIGSHFARGRFIVL